MQCDLNKQVGQTFHFRIADNVALFVKCDTLPMECLRALTACLSSSRMHRIVPHGSMQLTTFDKSKKALLNFTLLKAESFARLLRLFLASFSLSGTGRHLSKKSPIYTCSAQNTATFLTSPITQHFFALFVFIARCKIEHNEQWEEANRKAKMQMMMSGKENLTPPPTDDDIWQTDTHKLFADRMLTQTSVIDNYLFLSHRHHFLRHVIGVTNSCAGSVENHFCPIPIFVDAIFPPHILL
ncbi:hypothetical protein T07_7284 [Trichinella nelsoni]|uniref:Uncharacterized protein n=1 Tax=Trichinella nelsoni TaxID=6336 RepID=A0A0V0SE49_9BILA|nr:hypothetical protein T07_7284 [Trichinella nelsoni]